MSELNMDRVKEIFLAARGENGPDRERLISALCGEDEVLLERVRTLLDAEEDVGGFLASPTLADANAAALVQAADLVTVTSERPGSRIGPYKLLQVIGEGGFGVVYMAEQEEPIRRRVALKVIKPGMDTKQVIARFEAERQALAMMDHPNIAKVFEAGTTPAGRPYFVMELVKGIPITDYCDEHRLDTRQRLALFADVCAAVHHAHMSGIIHRDLKPSNVMVTLHEGTPVPKVIDFGVAKATHQRLTDTTLFTEYNQFIGTPTYMSPEQAAYEGLDVDDRADVYSLGVLLYELLTGTTPHAQAMKRAAYLEVVRILKEEEPPKPSTRIQTMGPSSKAHAEHRHADPVGLAKLLRGDLDWIVMKALDKERSRRYGSAAEMAADISRYFNQRPIVARPPSAMYRARKLLRRRQGTFATAAVMVLALMLDFAYNGWQRSQTASTLAAAAALPTTMAARQVWTGPKVGPQGSVSPDGRYLSFADWDSGNLGVHDLQTGEDRIVTSGGSWEAETYNYAEVSIWSPDGKQLAYTRYCDVRTACASTLRGDGYELRVTGVDGLDSRVLYSHEGSWYPNPGGWSPDGRSISVTLDGGSIGILSVDDGSLRILKSFEPGTANADGFSPDGEYIAYSHRTDEGRGNRDLYVMAVDGSREIRLTETGADEAVVGWAPDGSLLFKSDRTGRQALWSVGLANGTPTGPAVMLWAEFGDVRSLGMSLDGALFYASTPSPRNNAYTVAFDPETASAMGSPTPITDIGTAAHSAWSPDGETLAYLSPGGREQTLVIRSLETGNETTTILGMSAASRVQWHPDGESLFIGGTYRGTTGLFHIDASTDAPPRLVHGSRYAVVGPDGETVYSGEQESPLGAWALTKTDVETGVTTEYYEERDATRFFAISPDGREAFFVADTPESGRVIKIVSTAGGEARYVTDLAHDGEPIPVANRGWWTPDGAHLVIFGGAPEIGQRLYRVSTGGGGLEPAGLEVMVADKNPHGFSQMKLPQFRPDGRELSFVAVTEADQEVWVLDNFLPRDGGN